MGLDGRISAAVAGEMMRWAGARHAGSLPPLVWDRVADGAVVGAVGDADSADMVEQVLRPWVRALGLIRQPPALIPVAGAIAYSGTVDSVPVPVWGLAEHRAA